jgi:ABC-2 type transport system ATP-binding protein
MKRRLMIARSMVHEPKLLILDEPTAGVDVELRRGMWDFVTKMNKQGTTIILTTHYLEEAEQLCERIAIIDHGKIVENTSKKELLRKLDKETFVLDLKDPVDKIADTKNCVIRKVDDTTLEVDISKKDNLNELFNHLDKQNIKVLSMRTKTNRLEELFLGMVKNGR